MTNSVETTFIQYEDESYTKLELLSHADLYEL